MEHCLIHELSRLKQSSKEAVENIESFNFFKQYMHVERPFEHELIRILENISEHNQPRLVMVCGSVGDGKSHLISYLKSKNPNLFHKVTIHNDATESFSPTKTSVETLRKVLDPFTDRNLSLDQNGVDHVVMAINLGTLNNFLNSKYGKEYQTFRGYVEDKKILEESETSNETESDEYFQFVNLSDYHLYELTKQGVQSGFLESLFEKVTANSTRNPFYEKYIKSCRGNCPNRGLCSASKNYEILMRKDIQKNIVNLLAELIIKHKVIISPRMFLDFVYRIIVPDYIQDYDSVNTEPSKYIEDLLPNLLFDLGNRLEVFVPIQALGSVVQRDKVVDEWIVSFFITDNISKLAENIVGENSLQLLGIQDILINNGKKHEDKKVLIKTLLRLRAIVVQDEPSNSDSSILSVFLKYLYYWNTNNFRELRVLYYDVINAIYNWNGKAETERINMFVGRTQLKYAITQKIVIEPYTEQKTVITKDRLFKFLNYMVLKFKVEDSDCIYSINIDFNLFELLIKMKNGYRPNSKDKNNFINFADFVERMIKENVKQNSVEIRDKVSQDSKQYVLTVDTFGYEFKEK